MDKSLRQIAEERGLFYDGNALPYNRALRDNARKLRNSATLEERIVWKVLRRLPIQVLRQRTIDHFIVDFYIPKLKLAIELDGGQHYSEAQLMRDAERTDVLRMYGVIVMRVSNVEARSNPDGIAQHVLELARVRGEEKE